MHIHAAMFTRAFICSFTLSCVRSYARREDVDSKPWMSLPAFQALWARAVEVLQLNADTIGMYTGWLENSAAKLLPSVSTGV